MGKTLLQKPVVQTIQKQKYHEKSIISILSTNYANIYGV